MWVIAFKLPLGSDDTLGAITSTFSFDNCAWVSLELITKGSLKIDLYIYRSRSAPVSGLCWLFSVLHANLSVWVWISYFVFSYNYCWEVILSLKCPDCSTVACTGGIFLGISLVISIIAAIANDQYYPDARMTPREAKNFFAHIKRSHPELTVTLRSHLNSMGDWMKVKKVFFPRAWYDETVYPDLGQVMTGNRTSVVFKITMAVYAKSVEAKDDLRAFVWDFGQEYNQTITLEDVEDYMMHAALHPAQGQNAVNARRSLTQRYAGGYQGTGIPRKQPTLTTEKTIRIYVRRDGNLPFLMDSLLRFAWILNLMGWSGIVLHCLTKLHVSLSIFDPLKTTAPNFNSIFNFKQLLFYAKSRKTAPFQS